MRYFEMKFPTFKIQHKLRLSHRDEETVLFDADVCDTSSRIKRLKRKNRLTFLQADKFYFFFWSSLCEEVDYLYNGP